VKTKTLALLTALAAVSLPQAAFAFDPDKNTDVLSRPRPEFDARGVRLGSFMLFPSLSAGVAYHDNVFNRADGAVPGPVEDFLFTLSPTLKLNSNWSRHALNLFAESKSYFYQDFSNEDRTDWKVGGDVRLDIFGGTSLTVDGLYEEVTEPRGTDPSSIALIDSTEYSHWRAGATLNHVSGRFRGSLGANYDEFDYDDVNALLVAGNATAQCPGPNIAPPPALPAGVVACNNDDRDVSTINAFVKGGFELSPGYAVFVRGKFNDRDFTSANRWNFAHPLNPAAIFVAGQPAGLEVSDQNRNHDSQGWGVDVGVDFELARLVQGEAYIGYTEQSYDTHPFAPARTFQDTDAFTFGVDLMWYAQEMTTVTFNANRSIKDSLDVITGASGYISDVYGVRVDHELMRNVILYGKIGLGQDEYQQSIREDDILTGGVGAIFLVNNNLHVTASYDFVDRDSNLGAFDYTNNVFQLTLTGKL
jgi:hypothetical protein